MPTLKLRFSASSPTVQSSSHAALIAVLVATGIGFIPTAYADLTKANNTSALNLASSWTAGSLTPGASDILIWDNTVTAANSVLTGAPLSVAGIKLLNPGGAVTITGTSTNTLTIGASGIDMSSATQNLTLGGSGFTLGAAQTWNVGTGTVLTSTGVSGGGFRLTKDGAGELILGNNTNFSGGVQMNAGTLTLNNQNAVSGGSITAAGGTIKATAASALTTINAAGNFNINSTGTTVFNVLNLAGNTITSNGGTVQFRFASSTGGGTFNVTAGDLQFTGGALSGDFSKTGAGTLIFSTGTSTATGITVSNGILAITAAERFANTAKLTMSGGTFTLNGFTETLGTLAVTGAASIDLGSGGKAIFGASNGEDWSTGTLTIAGTFVSGSSIKFGSNSSGLTGAQLSKISIAGYDTIGLDSSGFLTAMSSVPEPSTYAVFFGAGTLGFATLRRRKRPVAA